MAPQVLQTPRDPDHEGMIFMAIHTISPAGDPFSSRRRPSTRHHRVDDGFLELLEEDFGISAFTLSNAFMGVPAEPKKSAIALCEWASRADDPGRAFLTPLLAFPLGLRYSSVVQERLWCDYTYPWWGGHTLCRGQLIGSVLGSSASLIGSELSSLLGSGPSLCPTPML
jgi:hypothetical protein